VTCEPCSCLSRFSRQSRPSRLSQASAIAEEALMNNAGQEEISRGFRLAKSDRAVLGGAGAKGSATPPPLLSMRPKGHLYRPLNLPDPPSEVTLSGLLQRVRGDRLSS
jgi:hypothetical protein